MVNGTLDGQNGYTKHRSSNVICTLSSGAGFVFGKTDTPIVLGCTAHVLSDFCVIPACRVGKRRAPKDSLRTVQGLLFDHGACRPKRYCIYSTSEMVLGDFVKHSKALNFQF